MLGFPCPKVPGLFSRQVPDHAPRNVMDVGGALPEIGVVNLLQGCRVPVGHPGEDVLHVEPIPLKGPQDLVQQRPILHHQEVSVKNAGILGSDRARNPLLQA